MQLSISKIFFLYKTGEKCRLNVAIFYYQNVAVVAVAKRVIKTLKGDFFVLFTGRKARKNL
jgi:hypothetical protein